MAALLVTLAPLSLSAGGVPARCCVKMQIGGGLAIKAIPPPPPPTAAAPTSTRSLAGWGSTTLALVTPFG